MAATPRKVNMTNVKEQGQFSPRHVPEGDYLVKIAKVDDHKSKEGNEMWVFTLVRPEDARATYPYYVGQDEKNAWKVRKLLLAAGFKAPKSVVQVDPNRLVGKTIGAAMMDDEYEGKIRSKIDDIFHKDEVTNDATDSDDDTTEEEVVEDEVAEDEGDPDLAEDYADETQAEPDPEPVKPAPRKRSAPKAAPAEDEPVEDIDLSELDEL